MCDTCGCGDPDMVPIEVQENILSANDRTARHNREHFARVGLMAVNLMGSPGSGKTAILEATARSFGTARRLGAISGDLATHNDADRLEAAGIPSMPITTGSACHLDAGMIHEALHDFPGGERDYLFIENVGNLVCPAVYDLGQAKSVVALSLTEGEDKPLKYPVMFRKADLVLLTKMDLLPHLEVSLRAIEDAISRVMPVPRILRVSAKTGEGINLWVEWLERSRKSIATGEEPDGHRHDAYGSHDTSDSREPEKHRHPHVRGG